MEKPTLKSIYELLKLSREHGATSLAIACHPELADELNADWPGFRVFKGVEVILSPAIPPDSVLAGDVAIVRAKVEEFEHKG